MDLLQLWALARRGWLLILTATVLGVAVAAGWSFLQPRVYTATSTGYVVAGNSSSVGDALMGRGLAADKAESYLPLVKSRSVAERVANEVGVSPSQVSLTGANDGVIFTVTARASSPELARAIADEGVKATSIAANELETMLVSGQSSGQTVVRIVPVELALTPIQPVSPNWYRNLAIGLGVGLLVGFGLVVLRHSLDRRVRLTSDVEELAGASALGVIPSAKALAKRPIKPGQAGEASEALRKLRTNLRFVGVDSPMRAMVVTSANEGEGKSTVAAHLAALMAESGKPTILVDADLRRPNVAKLFGMDGSVGLSQVLVGSVDLAEALIPVGAGLRILAAGQLPPNPSELVGSDRMQSLISELAQSATVVIDAPPLLPVTDAGLLTAAADGALLIVQHGSTRKEQVAVAVRNVETVNGAVLGVVMNKVPKKDMGSAIYGYGGGSTHSYYYQAGRGAGVAGEEAAPARGRSAAPARAAESRR